MEDEAKKNMILTLLFSLIIGVITFLVSTNMLDSTINSSLYLAGALAFFSLLALGVINFLTQRLSSRSALGMAVGLTISILLFFATVQVIDLINIQSQFVPIVKIVMFSFFLALGITLGIYKSTDSDRSFKSFGFGYRNRGGITKILDTSVIIDGRIADVSDAGFIDGEIIIPNFIIKELQYIADSSEATKRVRGRRGLDVLKRMQNDIPDLSVKITNHDFPNIREVDLKLVELAKKLRGIIITNDFNLNKVADLQKVKVLNLNELSNALKPIVLPGEIIHIQLVKEGKEHNQALGYLDDGTMVVVDDARRSLGKEVNVSVTSVLQTSTGRMIFAKIEKDNIVSRING